MDTVDVLYKILSFSLDLVEIIDAYANSVFVLDKCGIYILDGRGVELYMKLLDTKIYSNLVYAANKGLCYRGREYKDILSTPNNIHVISLESKTQTVYSNQNYNINLIGGKHLYFLSGCELSVPILELNILTEKYFFKKCIHNSVYNKGKYIISVGGVNNQGYNQGYNQDRNKDTHASTYIYDTETKSLIEGKPDPYGCKTPLSVCRGKYIYVLGGYIFDKGGLFYEKGKGIGGMGIKIPRYVSTNRVNRYDCEKDEWIDLCPLPQVVIDAFAIIIDVYIYIIGCDPTLRYHIPTDKWQIVEDFTFNPKCSAINM